MFINAISGVRTDGGQGGIRSSMLVQALAALFLGYVCANNTAAFKYFIGAGILELLSPCLRN